MAEEEFEQEYLDDELMDFVGQHFQGLGFERDGEHAQADVEYLRGDEFFFQLFRIIQRNVPAGFDEEGFINEILDYQPDKRIQALLELIQSQEVLGIDLGYIKGSEVVSGNIYHVRNLLQLIYALSRSFGDDEEEEYNMDDVEYEEDALNIDDLITNHEERDLNSPSKKSNIQSNRASRKDYEDKLEQRVTSGMDKRDSEYNFEEPQQLKPRKFPRKKSSKKPRKTKKRPVSQYNSSTYSNTTYRKPTKFELSSVKKPIVRTIERNLYGKNTVSNVKRLRSHQAVKNQVKNETQFPRCPFSICNPNWKSYSSLSQRTPSRSTWMTTSMCKPKN